MTQADGDSFHSHSTLGADRSSNSGQERDAVGLGGGLVVHVGWVRVITILRLNALDAVLHNLTNAIDDCLIGE